MFKCEFTAKNEAFRDENGNYDDHYVERAMKGVTEIKVINNRKPSDLRMIISLRSRSVMKGDKGNV